MIDLRSAREWLAETVDGLLRRALGRPAETQQLAEVVPLRPLWNVPPPLGDQRPATCPCGHARGQHYSGHGRCLSCGEACWLYRGPWPVHHLHVTRDACEECGVTGSHWAVRMGQRLCLYPSFSDMPGEE